MADYNRNPRSSYRTSNHDWNENRDRVGRENDRTHHYNENAGNRNRSGYDDTGSEWQSRYEREDYNRGGGYSTGRYGRHYDSDFAAGNYGGDRDYGYASYYGSGAASGISGSMKGSRELYDRDYEGMNRSDYRGTRLGAGNYENYGDRNRGYYEGRNEGHGYGGYRSANDDRDRDRENEDRNWWDRTSDEVSSWFGDDDAERRRERDREMRGRHRGKGPKNYSRSDERIKEDINDRLSDDPFIDATEIEVSVMNGEVTLMGIVEERSDKRRAEDIAESVSGVKNVENRLRVGQISDVRNPEKGSGTTSSREPVSETTSPIPGSERTRATKSYVTG